MVDYKTILKLSSENYSLRQIAASVGHSHHTVKDVLELNESYRELAEYYGTAIVPARVRKPQDKGLVEKSVGFTSTWIIAALCERKFFSFTEVKEAVAERLEVINTKQFQERPGNRREAYISEEKEFMLPLPKYPYEPSIWRQQTVGKPIRKGLGNILFSI